MRVVGILLGVMLCVAVGYTRAMAQERTLGVAYYDVEALYDTIPSQFYDDSDYTPRGAMRWSGERYERKLRHTAAVIDSMAMPLVALYGVESEQVVRDLVASCDNLYSYVHRTSDFNRGEDFALLYYGDWFVSERVRQYSSALCIEGRVVGGGAVAIIVHHRSPDLEYIVRQVRKANGQCRLIVAGDSYGVDFSRLGVADKCLAAERKGLGNRVWRDKWQMSDRIASDISGRAECGVYIRHWLLTESGVPLPTYLRGRYVGGYSSRLPVYVYFDDFFVN